MNGSEGSGEVNQEKDETNPLLNEILEELEQSGNFNFDQLDIPPDGYNVSNKCDQRLHHTIKCLDNFEIVHEPKSVFIQENYRDNHNQDNHVPYRQTITSQEIIILSKSYARRDYRRMELEDEITVDHKADGTKESMMKWAGKEGYNLDLRQRLAFQAIISSFVLTFVDEARYVESASDVSTTRAHMRALRRDLLDMIKIRTFGSMQHQSYQLLMFMVIRIRDQ